MVKVYGIIAVISFIIICFSIDQKILKKFRIFSKMNLPLSAAFIAIAHAIMTTPVWEIHGFYIIATGIGALIFMLLTFLRVLKKQKPHKLFTLLTVVLILLHIIFVTVYQSNEDMRTDFIMQSFVTPNTLEDGTHTQILVGDINAKVEVTVKNHKLINTNISDYKDNRINPLDNSPVSNIGIAIYLLILFIPLGFIKKSICRYDLPIRRP